MFRRKLSAVWEFDLEPWDGFSFVNLPEPIKDRMRDMARDRGWLIPEWPDRTDIEVELVAESAFIRISVLF